MAMKSLTGDKMDSTEANKGIGASAEIPTHHLRRFQFYVCMSGTTPSFYLINPANLLTYHYLLGKMGWDPFTCILIHEVPS